MPYPSHTRLRQSGFPLPIVRKPNPVTSRPSSRSLASSDDLVGRVVPRSHGRLQFSSHNEAYVGDRRHRCGRCSLPAFGLASAKTLGEEVRQEEADVHTLCLTHALPDDGPRGIETTNLGRRGRKGWPRCWDAGLPDIAASSASWCPGGTDLPSLPRFSPETTHTASITGPAPPRAPAPVAPPPAWPPQTPPALARAGPG